MRRTPSPENALLAWGRRRAHHRELASRTQSPGDRRVFRHRRAGSQKQVCHGANPVQRDELEHYVREPARRCGRASGLRLAERLPAKAKRYQNAPTARFPGLRLAFGAVSMRITPVRRASFREPARRRGKRISRRRVADGRGVEAAQWPRESHAFDAFPAAQ